MTIYDKKSIKLYNELFSMVRPLEDEGKIRELLKSNEIYLHCQESRPENRWKTSLPAHFIVGAFEAGKSEDTVLEILKLMHKKDPDNQKGIKNGRYWVPILYSTLTRNYFKVAEFLVNEAKVPVDQAGDDGSTALCLLIKNNGNDLVEGNDKKRVTFLLDNGADPRKKNRSEGSAIGLVKDEEIKKLFKQQIKKLELKEEKPKEKQLSKNKLNILEGTKKIIKFSSKTLNSNTNKNNTKITIKKPILPPQSTQPFFIKNRVINKANNNATIKNQKQKEGTETPSTINQPNSNLSSVFYLFNNLIEKLFSSDYQKLPQEPPLEA